MGDRINTNMNLVGKCNLRIRQLQIGDLVGNLTPGRLHPNIFYL